MVKLSVIIPCFNGFEYLKHMIDCCERQTFTDWELIIVDDGSTDDTSNKISTYSSRNSRIKFFQRDRLPKGSLTCRNIGFKHSSGQYIIHFDADDIFTDDCFENRVKYMDEHPECDYATFLAQGFHCDGEQKMVYERFYGVFESERDLLERFLSVSYPFSIWCNIYRRHIVEKYPWDESVKVYSDFSYALPMIFDGINHSFAQNTTPDYLYRRFYSKQNMCSSAVNPEKCTSTNYLFTKVLEILSSRSDSDIRKKQFLRFIVLHFERLVNGRNEYDVNEYINILKPFYERKLINQFNKISAHCLKMPNYSLLRVSLDFYLYRYFKFSIYRIQFLHSLAKIFFFKR